MDRKLYLPNAVIVDREVCPNGSRKAAMQVIGKLAVTLPVIFIEHISFEESFEIEESPLIERDHYQVFKSREFKQEGNKLISYKSGSVNAYKIACETAMFRRAFVHVYDILGQQIPMVILCNNFYHHTQPFAFLLDEVVFHEKELLSIEESHKCTLQDFLDQSVRLIDGQLVMYM
jgi:hypothetical protein